MSDTYDSRIVQLPWRKRTLLTTSTTHPTKKSLSTFQILTRRILAKFYLPRVPGFESDLVYYDEVKLKVEKPNEIVPQTKKQATTVCPRNYGGSPIGDTVKVLVIFQYASPQ
jgi:hypothetical protein